MRSWASAAATAALAAVVSACSAGGSAPPAGNVFTVSQQVSLQQVERAIDGLYSSHPGIGSFSVQDVQYTAASRDTVLRECTSGVGGTAGSQTAESGQIIACAPLIFFLYSYGRQASVPASVNAAGELYWYAITHITGPVSARTSLDELLQSWKMPVPGLTPAEARNALLTSVINAASDSILAQKGVRVVITGRPTGSTAVTERIVADIGTDSGAESIISGAATATIRVTRHAAYFTGTPAGLTTFIGLSHAAAVKAGSRWVAINSGTTEYNDLATEDTIASLPNSILPGSGDAPQMHAATMSGRKVYVLDWKAASGSGTTISEELILDATTQALPISETTTANGQSQTVTLDHWGEQVTVPVPPSAVPYARVKG